MNTNTYTIEIDDSSGFAVRLYENGADAPFLYQPHWPSGDLWSSRQEASDWGNAYITSITDENAPYAPGGPGQEPQPKPTPLEIAQNKLGAVGLSVDDLKALLGL